MLLVKWRYYCCSFTHYPVTFNKTKEPWIRALISIIYQHEKTIFGQISRISRIALIIAKFKSPTKENCLEYSFWNILSYLWKNRAFLYAPDIVAQCFSRGFPFICDMLASQISVLSPFLTIGKDNVTTPLDVFILFLCCQDLLSNWTWSNTTKTSAESTSSKFHGTLQIFT